MGKDIVFVCSPSAAMLDMWLPILQDLRQRLSGSEIVFLVPLARQVGVFDLQSSLFTKTSEIFDSVVCPSVTGRWKQFKTVAEAKEFHESESLVRVWRKFKYSGLVQRLRRPIGFAHRIMSASKSLKGASAAKNVLIDLFDREPVILMNIFELTKPYMAEIEQVSRNVRKFSMYHGIRFETEPTMKVERDKKYELSNTTAFVFSDREIETYRQNFGLEQRDIRVIGIPRHQEKWLKNIESVDRVRVGELPSRFILVVSRPSADHPTFSRARKVASLKNIKNVAKRYDLKIVIKLHPKEELDDGTGEEVFGAENEGKTWMYSRKHPLVLGKMCTFAVTFLSSVAVDLSRLGIPVIEHIDTTSDTSVLEPGHGHQGGHAGSIFAKLGFAAFANSRDDFERRADEVMNNRKMVSKKALEAYTEIFPIIDNVIEEISEEIKSEATRIYP